MSSDLKNSIAPIETLAPANRSDPSVPVNGTGVDRAGYDGVVVLIHTGTIGGSSSPSQTFQIQESDDNSSFTAVAAGDLDGSIPVIDAAADDTLYEIGYKGTKRYLRVAITAKAGTTPALVSSAVVVRGKARKYPA